MSLESMSFHLRFAGPYCRKRHWVFCLAAGLWLSSSLWQFKGWLS
jgi:hypothetical protein